MSPRRTFLALTVGILILAGLGLRDWTIEAGRATAFADRAMAGFGIALTAQGPAHLTLLPWPRLTLDRVHLAASGPAGPMLSEGGRLTVDLEPFTLLAGRAAIAGAVLDGARLSRDPAAWAGPIARLSERMRAGVGERPRRIGLRNARLSDAPGAADAERGGADATDIDLDLAWPLWSASAEASAALRWRGVPTRIALTRLRPVDLAAGRPSPFTVEATWPGGSLAAEGSATSAGAGDGDGNSEGIWLPALSGRARFETRALPETLAWLGRNAPLASLAGAFTLEGSFEGAGRSVSWPRLRVAVGSDVLEGAGAFALGAGAAPRLSIQATLAAETLNLAPLFGRLVRLFESEPIPLALAPLTRGDLDLRLSAALGRIGPIRVDDLAASVLVREASVEVAVNRARVQDGTLKGRLILARGADPAETEVKAQGSLDRIDLGQLLGEIGEARWIQGPMQGQFVLESSARDAATLLARVGGRVALSVEGGAIAGLDLADVVHRNGTVAPGALARRNGRTVFERASVGLRFSEGVGEITDAILRGPGIGATLRGQISLPEKRIDAQAGLSLRPPADPSRGLLFEIAGPWDAPTAQALARTDPADPQARGGEASLPGPFNLPAANLPAASLPAANLPATLGLGGNARAYAP